MTRNIISNIIIEITRLHEKSVTYRDMILKYDKFKKKNTSKQRHDKRYPI